MAKYLVNDTTLNDIACAIRSKCGSTEPIKVCEFADEIETIKAEPNLTTLVTEVNGTFTPENGYDGFDKVVVNTPKSSFMDLVVHKNGVYDPKIYGKDGFSMFTVDIPESGGECSGNHIIEVETLPTENIDENALYKMGESYYKAGEKEFKDLLAVEDGTKMSYVDAITQQGATLELFYVDNYENVANPQPFMTGTTMSMYYDAHRNDVFMYDEGWFSASLMMEGMTNGGAITDASEATEETHYYALISNGWKAYRNGILVIEVNELPTESINTDAIYCVKATECVNVMIPAGSLGFLDWKAYCVNLGIPHNIFNVEALPTENIGETIDGVSSYPYYVTSENKVYVYQGGAWVSNYAEAVMGTTESYYTYGNDGFELLISSATKDAEVNAQIKRECSWGNGTRHFKYTLSDDGTHYELDVGQRSTLKNWVVASEINGIPVTKIKGASGYSVPDNPYSLATLVIPDTITEIGAHSFYTVASVDVLIIGKGVTYIRDPFLMNDFPVKLIVYAGTEEEWAAVDKPAGGRFYESIVYGS